MKKDVITCRFPIRIAVILVAFAVFLPFFSIGVYAEEGTDGQEENTVYDSLKDRMETAWDKGMEQIEDVEPIEMTGNFMERVMRSLADSLMRNLKSVKAGALLIGSVSFVLGGVIVLLARKDKKIRKKAAGICMAAIPGLLLVLVFGLSWFVSMFL